MIDAETMQMLEKFAPDAAKDLKEIDEKFGIEYLRLDILDGFHEIEIGTPAPVRMRWDGKMRKKQWGKR